MSKISVIIPSYRNPRYLDLCLKSLTENQVNDNQIIVVLDGYAEETSEVLSKYPMVDVLPFETNQGVMIAHNYGVYAAENDRILIINDDNVAPRSWDERLNKVYSSDAVTSVNQIEHSPSIFKPFVIENLGKTVDTFDYDWFLEFEQSIRSDVVLYNGQTFPFLMSKTNYMAVGGFDVSYPARNGAVADHDFFMRCELAGLRLVRYYGVHFYHFVSTSTSTDKSKSTQNEQLAHEYFNWKWGFYSKFDPHTLSHYPDKGVVRGVIFNEEY